MSKLPNIKRLLVEEFPDKYRDLMDKLAYVINQFFESIVASLNNGLTFSENFAAQETDVEVTAPVNSSNTVTVKSTLRSTCKGIWITKVEDLTDVNAQLSAAPFVQFTNSSGQIVLTNITGLVSGHKYRLHIIALS